MRSTIFAVVLCVLLTAGVAGAGNLFTDTFDRPDSTDIDSSSVGMSGSLSPAYVETFEGSGLANSIQVLNNQLRMAVGAGMSDLYLDHNFTDAGEFSISLDVIEINSATSDITNRFAGFGLGMSLDEANNLGDVNTSAMTMAHQDADTQAVPDFFCSLALDGLIRVWSNGEVLGSYDAGVTTGTLMAEFEVTSFDAGATVTYKIFFDGAEITSLQGSFTWDYADTNYMGLSCRASNYAVVDNLVILSSEPIPSFPSPADQSQDVSYDDLLLTWRPGGDIVAGYDVYLGTVFDDVNEASRSNPMGVLVSQGQDANSYGPGVLDFGQTYFWRVDQIENAAATTIHKGDVWQFMVEPFAYAVEGVVATTNLVSVENQGPENAVNGSGLDASDLHATDETTMWAAVRDPDVTPYIQFEFDRIRRLHEMRVWNHNTVFEAILGFGLKHVTVEHSLDGADWTVLGDFELARGTGKAGLAAGSVIAFDGAVARYVRLVVNSTWVESAARLGLSEVRFMDIPMVARLPEPADGATDVSVNSPLAWRAGRGAISHEVYLSSDSDVVAGGTALVETVTERRYNPGGLDLDTTYYWQINEVNEADAVPSWPGDLWSFSTQKTILVDGFEDYTDDIDAGRTIWQTWIDGVDTPALGGSVVGYDQSPFAEQAVVRTGRQAMPLFFSNDGGNVHSEATRTFASAQDWAGNGIESLSLYVYGAADNSGGQLYAKINGVKVLYNSVSDVLQRPQWVHWLIDLASVGTDLTGVTSLTIGIDGPGASGVVYVDDIHLTAQAVHLIEPALPSDSDPALAAYYPFEGNTNDSKGAYNATAVGSIEYVAGYAGQAVSLNGVSESVVSDFAQEVVWPAYSVSVWVKAGLLAQPNFASVFNNNSSASDFQIDVDGTNPGNYRYHGSVDANYGVVTAEWVHLATCCDGVQTSLYYNGLLVATADVADTNFGQLAFGVNRAGDVWFSGAIDEARIYDRALSAAAVAGLAGITDVIVE